MPQQPMPYIKRYVHRLHDPRLASLSDRQQLRYHQLYLLAGHCNACGDFTENGKPMTVTAMAYILHIENVDQLAQDITALKKAGLIRANGHGPYIADFRDEQGDYVAKLESNRARQAKFRATRNDNALVTRDADVSNNTEKKRLKEIKRDKNNKESKPVVLVVADAINFYEINIGNVTGYVEKEIAAMFDLDRGTLMQALQATADQGKHSMSYLKGVFENMRKGTQKQEPRKKPVAKLPSNGVAL